MAFNAVSLEKRFWEKVAFIPFHTCWEWDAARFPTGYGAFGKGLAHRFSYELHKGSIPVGLQICHTCDNPGCVNPDHLYAGTAKDNAADKMRRGRYNNQNIGKTFCVRGHPLFGSNLYLNPSGSRQCRVCQKSTLLYFREKYNQRRRVKRAEARLVMQ